MRIESNRRGVIYYEVVLPPTIALELIVWGNAASCYVEKPRLGGFGEKYHYDQNPIGKDQAGQS